MLEKLQLFSTTHEITYIAGYLLCMHTNIERVTIFGHCHTLLKNAYKIPFQNLHGKVPMMWSHSIDSYTFEES